MSSSEIKDKTIRKYVEGLASRLRRRQVVGSHATALETVKLLRQVVSAAKFTSLDQLVKLVRAVGRELVAAQPKEYSVGNTVRKVLRLIREEYNAALATATISPSNPSTPSIRTTALPGVASSSSAQTPSTFNPPTSLSSFVLLGLPRSNAEHVEQPHAQLSQRQTSSSLEVLDDFKAVSVKPALIGAIEEVIDDLETVYENVAKNARDHIHSDEIILTIGQSSTVETFLKSAAHYRKFTVIVAETAPSFSGRDMAKSLAAEGITTVLVPDSCIFALMSRVNKVILGAHAVLANGGVFAVAGTLLAASAAKAHATPVVICTGQYKFTPLWNLYHEFAAVDFGDPNEVLGVDGSDDVDIDQVDVVNAYFDYVKPELVDVLITNDGDLPPSYVYRLVKETYDDEDVDL
ncbi:GCD complex subunit gcd7 [Tulasnella sp. JGI-2019a]|nr:GCD complex subunit gcd7 [Tulasnella sp. JGI-2019a]KAG9014613.1 GCD complex subunit gcd7 [Tulasnella sp. JGI-2019a]KAG9038950.1 GCD complex subunit gcd7 [Tulasnella sp. JGI-2019a]